MKAEIYEKAGYLYAKIKRLDAVLKSGTSQGFADTLDLITNEAAKKEILEKMEEVFEQELRFCKHEFDNL